MDSNKTPQSTLKSLRDDISILKPIQPQRNRLTEKLTALTEALELLAYDSLQSTQNSVLGGHQSKTTPPSLKLVR